MAFQVISENQWNILMVQQFLNFLEFRFLLFRAGWATISPTNLVLCMKGLKSVVFTILALKPVASFLE